MGPAARWSSVTPTLTGCALTTPAAACQVWMGCPGTLGTSTAPSSSFNGFPAADRVLTTVGLDLSPGSGCGFPPRLLLLGWLIRNSGIPLSSGPAPLPPHSRKDHLAPVGARCPLQPPTGLGRGEGTQSQRRGQHRSQLPRRRREG